MDKLICDKYAQALFELAKEQDKCLPVEESVNYLLDAVSANPDFGRLLSHPGIDGDEKMRVIKSILKDPDKDLEGFIALVFARGRGDIIKGIFESYTELSRQYRNVVCAEIVSAVPLTEDRLKRIVDVLEKKLGKTVEPDVRVDSSLIGGLKITVCGHMINSTIKSRLDELKSLLESSKTSEERRDAV